MPYLSVNRKRRGTFEVDVEGHRILVEDRPTGTGHGAGPTPGELLISGLVANVAAAAESFLSRNRLRVDGLAVTCHYRCSAAQPHEISSADITLCVPADLPADRRSELMRTVGRCAGPLVPEVAFMLVTQEPAAV